MTLDERVSRKLGWLPLRWKIASHNAIMHVSSESVRDQHLAMGWRVLEVFWPPVSTDWSVAGRAMDIARSLGVEIQLTAAEPGFWATGTKHPDWTTPYCHGQELGPLAIAKVVDLAFPMPEGAADAL